MPITAWGGLRGETVAWRQPAFSSEIAADLRRVRGAANSRALVIGNLRSYGDEVINPDGRYVQTTRCDRILGIDAARGTVSAECGVRLDELQRRLSSRGYLLPVTPGTAYLTLGGAIANDVHGKNHHVQGSFGRFVQGFELVRTDGQVLWCSPEENPEYFAATIGGMGLTGAITRATVTLRRIDSPQLEVSAQRFANLDAFFDLDAACKDRHEYTVAWIDCLATGGSLGRGVYGVGDHRAAGAGDAPVPYPAKRYRASVPFTPPISPVNHATLVLMNSLYYRLQRTGPHRVHFREWLYPLDAIDHWNRLYGRPGFFQFQCVVPPAAARAAIAEMLKLIGRRGQGSFLAVLKNFGAQPSPGLLSFPMPGTTLALDFPNRGAKTRALLMELYGITAQAGGRLYPAKDACSPQESLAAGYPHFERFKRLIDPGLESVMSRRLGLTG